MCRSGMAWGAGMFCRLVERWRAPRVGASISSLSGNSCHAATTFTPLRRCFASSSELVLDVRVGFAGHGLFKSTSIGLGY